MEEIIGVMLLVALGILVIMGAAVGIFLLLERSPFYERTKEDDEYHYPKDGY